MFNLLPHFRGRSTVCPTLAVITVVASCIFNKREQRVFMGSDAGGGRILR